MHFAAEHCFVCALALLEFAEEDYPSAHKTFTTTRLKRYTQFRWKGSKADWLKTLL